MKNGLWLVGLMVLMILCPVTSMGASENPILPADEYIIGPGDILDISVWKDEALSKLVTVLPDGRISFPLIGQVAAGGKTVRQLRENLERKLSRFVPDLSLSVIVHQVNSMMVYVIGRVNRPDRFILNTNANVLQALSMAGGLNPFAKRSKIKIFRSENGKTKTISFNYNEVTKGEKLEQNIMLIRGDVVVVP